ncbi:flagellar transcriptional regulator FlhC [Castellaniella sp.]|uniref:flagellar transcriptional regulator FlhC n=1 Tax=Castellaniella sp. TaxID=1955812 RepID=UPI00355F3188
MSRVEVAQEATDILLASEMIRLGARLQVLQAETRLSYERLARLYRDIRGHSAPKGMLPYSLDWYMTWMPNLHSSVFFNVYRYLRLKAGASRTEALVEAYKLYLEQVQADLLPVSHASSHTLLSFTRAWMMLRFFDSGQLQGSRCVRCHGLFVAHAHDPDADYVCGLCKPPPRAGKSGRKARAVPA